MRALSSASEPGRPEVARGARSPGRVRSEARPKQLPSFERSCHIAQGTPALDRFEAPRWARLPRRMSPSRPPTKRLSRLLQLAEVGARSGGALLLQRGAESAARRAAEVLGNLRGLAAKAGQMASYVDGFVPEAQREVYQQALSKLQAAAPSSSPDAVRLVVEQELGQPLATLFRSFELEPFASASIGQVHRAELQGGLEVAVKVQHPGIEEAVESDLSNIGLIEGLVSGLGPKSLNAHAIYEVIRARFREELDYRLEAQNVAFFAELHREDPRVHIPGVVASHSSRRVLTTEFARGMTLEQLQQAPEPLRRELCEVLWRFVFKGILVGGRFNADPHPGNYIFHADGSISFLDFGCVQVLDPDHLQQARAGHRAALARDEAGFRRHTAALLGTRGGSYEKTALDFSRACFEPLFASPFNISRGYVAELSQHIIGLKKSMLARDKSFVQLPPNMIFLNRLQFGFYSLLARLDVTVDYAAVERELLGEG
jgi:predicted unusual protein kinase regulating ubiquinone biosynthesis (AarF/ABC1/UbiB family)